MTSSNPNKDDTTDPEENLLSDGDSQKDTTSVSSFVRKKKVTSKSEVEANTSNSPVPPSCSNNQQRRNFAITTTHIPSLRTNVTSNKNTSRLVVFNPPKHVLQPHSHRRHFNHHLRDHFSSQILRPCNTRKEHQKEIRPTLDSCEYKATNFLTEGSPPRTPVARPHMKAKVLSGSLSEDRSSKRELSTKRIKSVRLLPASLWKESPEKLHVQSRSSPDSESGSENEKTVKLLHKYQNESVDGPLQKTDKKFSYKKSAFEDVDVNQSVKSPIRAHNKPWQTQSCSPIKSKGLEHRKGSPKTASGKSGSNRSSFSFNNPSILRSGGHTKLHKCQNCVKRRQNSRTAGTQTDALHEIVPNQDELIEKVVEKSLHNADMLLYHLPVGVESSESASYSTEDTSSMTFDDDDVIHYVTPVSEPRSPVSRSDILFRIDEIQTKLQQIKEDTGCGLLQIPPDKCSLDSFIHRVFAEMNEVVSEVSELYDRFDSEEKDEQSEFNELKRQIQQYKRTCRVLEYELTRLDSHRKEGLQTSELQNELMMSEQISTALYWELQNVDGKLQKVKAENQVFRESLSSSDVHRDVLEREVVQLRNAVDQMSLHASAIPTNENASVKSRDTVPELYRQIQFHEEERKVMLKKLVETDKEKDRLDDKLQLYVSQYGELDLENHSGNTEEVKINDLKARIRMEEDQAGMLSRRIMELQTENENLIALLNNNAGSLPNPETPSRFSQSDIQFLEDEAETLRMTLEETENENMALRYELKQFQEKSIVDEKKFQNFQTAQTSLKGLATPTTSDKIAAWDAMDPGTPNTNQTDTDFTISGADYIPVLSAIDACTQTYLDQPRPSITPRDRSPVASLTRDLVAILNRTRITNVESLVSQVTQLAVTARHLVDDPSTPSSLRSTVDLHSSMMRDEQDSSSLETVLSPVVEELTLHTFSEREENILDIEKFHILLLMMMAYIIVTSLSVTSSIKLGILSIIFFLI